MIENFRADELKEGDLVISTSSRGYWWVVVAARKLPSVLSSRKSFIEIRWLDKGIWGDRFDLYTGTPVEDSYVFDGQTIISRLE